MTHPSDIAGLSDRDDPALKRVLNIALLIEHGCDEAFATRTVDLWNAKCAALARAEQQRDEAYERLKALVDADALAGVRKLVAGWNGEDRPEGLFNERHPDRLGATLPKTNCGAIYQLDDAMVAASDLIRRLASGPEGGSEGEK